MGANESKDNNIFYFLSQSDIIKILPESISFFPDEAIKGDIIINASHEMTITNIEIQLYQFEGWRNWEKTNEPQTEMSIFPLCKTLLKIKEQLNQPSKLIKLEEGEHKFNFNFFLPKNIYPSFEFPLYNKGGFIRYIINAKILSPYIKQREETDNIIIIKSKQCTLDSPLSFLNYADVYSWGYFSKGTTLLSASYKTNNYQIEDIVPLSVYIDNTKGGLSVKSIKVNLRRMVTFKLNKDIKFQIPKILFEQTYAFVVPKGEIKSYSCGILVKDVDEREFSYGNQYNPFPEIKDINILLPSVDSDMISCEYSIKVSCYFDSFVTQGNRPRVVLPILVTHKKETIIYGKKINDNNELKEVNNENEVKKKEEVTENRDNGFFLFEQENKVENINSIEKDEENELEEKEDLNGNEGGQSEMIDINKDD